MKPWIKTFCCSIAVVALATIGRNAPAASEDAVRMETVVVTGTRTEQAVQEIPAHVTVIDEEAIENANANNVAELLRSEAAVVVRDLYGNGKVAQVDLRGFGETGPYNTLVLVDGRRVNEIDLSGVDWTQIPLDQIERIEIVRGAGSVLYGDNASGGVINIITRTPDKGFSAAVAGTGGSYGRAKGWARASGGTDQVAAFLSASYDSMNGYRENGYLRTRDVGAKVAYDPTDTLSFNLSGAHHSDDYGLPGPLTEAAYAADRRQANAPDDGAENTDQYLKLDTRIDFGALGYLAADLGYRYRDTDEEFVSYSFSAQRQIDTWSFTPRYVFEKPLFARPNTLIAGADFYWAEMDLDTFYGAPLSPSNRSNVSRDSYGFYLNNDLSVLDNLILSLGARREAVEYDMRQEDLSGFLAPLDDTVDAHENAYSAGLTYLYQEESSVFVRANRSFRFPLTDELVVYDFNSGSIQINPDLHPQRGDHLETGVRHFITPDIEANLTLFQAKIKDEIFYNKDTYTNENHPETLHRGLELGAKARIVKHLMLYGNYTYEKATFEKDPYEGRDIPGVPRHRANLGFRLHDFITGMVFSADYNYVGDSYAISDQANAFSKQGSYYTVNARLAYAWKNIKAFVGVNNLTNQDYSEYVVIGGFPTAPNYYPAPDRNYIFGVEWAF